MIRLTDEKIAEALNVHYDGKLYVDCVDCGMDEDAVRNLAKAQLKQVVDELERQIGIYSRTADDGRVWLPIGKFRQALLDEVKDET